MAIVGGGPAGAVAALVLARRGVPVTVIESRAGPASRVGETLPPSLAPLLRTLGLEAGLEQDRQAGHHLRSQGNRACWGAPQPVESPFLAHPEGTGWHVDRCRFEARLAEAAVQAGAAWRWGCRATVLPSSVQGGGRKWRLALETVEPPGIGTDRWAGGAEERRDLPSAAAHLEADFIADATGRVSSVARRLEVRRLRYDRLVGISTILPAQSPPVPERTRACGTAGRAGPAVLASAAPVPAAGWPLEHLEAPATAEDGAPAVRFEDTYTLVEATPDGWWYSALLGSGRLAVALLGDGDLLDRTLLARGDNSAAWWRSLRQTDATRDRVEAHGAGEAATRLQILPAESSRLDAIAGEGWLALGDAAAAYDPLSSHGVASAMGSGFYGGNAIADLVAGRTEASAAYLDLMQRAYGAYLDILRERYTAERRWPDAPFWQRRHAAGYGLEPI